MLMGCATHLISAECRGCQLNSYLTYTINCGGQLVDKSEFYSSHLSQAWYQIIEAREMEDIACLCGTRTRRIESRNRRLQQLHYRRLLEQISVKMDTYDLDLFLCSPQVNFVELATYITAKKNRC